VRKVRQAGALYGGRQPSRHEEEPLGFRIWGVERRRKGKNERGRWKGRCFSPGHGGGRAWEAHNRKRACGPAPT
jgi:hypothetical protein